MRFDAIKIKSIIKKGEDDRWGFYMSPHILWNVQCYRPAQFFHDDDNVNFGCSGGKVKCLTVSSKNDVFGVHAGIC